MFTAPTALRAIRREDPDNKYFKRAGGDGSLKNLRALFLAGERSEPSIVSAYQKLLEQYCAPGAQVIDVGLTLRRRYCQMLTSCQNWWSSESGSPISGLALMAPSGKDLDNQDFPAALRIKPGSAGKAAPGFNVMIVDDDGKEVSRGEMGESIFTRTVSSYLLRAAPPCGLLDSHLSRSQINTCSKRDEAHANSCDCRQHRPWSAFGPNRLHHLVARRRALLQRLPQALQR